MSGKSSRDKGKRYELKVVHFLNRTLNIGATRRVEQWRSGGDDIEHELESWISIEAKDVAAVSLGAWLDQAVRSAGPERLAAVIHHRRGNGLPELDFVTMRADHWTRLVKEARS